MWLIILNRKDVHQFNNWIILYTIGDMVSNWRWLQKQVQWQTRVIFYIVDRNCLFGWKSVIWYAKAHQINNLMLLYTTGDAVSNQRQHQKQIQQQRQAIFWILVNNNNGWFGSYCVVWYSILWDLWCSVTIEDTYIRRYWIRDSIGDGFNCKCRQHF